MKDRPEAGLVGGHGMMLVKPVRTAILRRAIMVQLVHTYVACVCARARVLSVYFELSRGLSAALSICHSWFFGWGVRWQGVVSTSVDDKTRRTSWGRHVGM